MDKDVHIQIEAIGWGDSDSGIAFAAIPDDGHGQPIGGQYNRNLIQCGHCAQWGEEKSACQHCGAPIDEKHEYHKMKAESTNGTAITRPTYFNFEGPALSKAEEAEMHKNIKDKIMRIFGG